MALLARSPSAHKRSVRFRRKCCGVADRAYVLELGKVAKHGTGQELLHDDDVRKAYLGA